MDPELLYIVCPACKGAREARRTCTRCFRSGLTPLCKLAEYRRMERVTAAIDSVKELLVETPLSLVPDDDDDDDEVVGPRLADTGTDDADHLS